MEFKGFKRTLLSIMLFGLPFAFHPQMSANQNVTEPAPKQELAYQDLLTDQDIQSIENLLGTIKERIDIMEHVSAYKWNRGKPILEIDNEQQLLQNIVIQAKKHNVSPEKAKEIFSKQLEAAQIAQINEFERLVQIKAGDVEEKLEDPQAALAEINSRLFIHSKEALPALQKHSAQKVLQVKIEAIFANVDPDIVKAATAPFVEQ
ncbi:MAG: hypothetical protein SNF33_08000 [Candidatus Algichlamydia australiensis]|nr:hypothetical protein [Chlamydiales bacterium]